MNEGGGDAEMVSEKLLALVKEAIAVSGFSETQVFKSLLKQNLIRFGFY